MAFRVDLSICGPFVENELILCESTSFIAEKVVDLAEVLMDAVVLRLTASLFEFTRAHLNYRNHLLIIVDILNDKNLRHLKYDQQLHRDELIEEEVEGEEGGKRLLSGVRRVLENIVHPRVLGIDESAGLRGVDASDDEDKHDVESHKCIYAFIET